MKTDKITSKPMKMKFSDIISDKTREDLLVTALEGASSYWYFLHDKACLIASKHRIKTPDFERGNALSERVWRAIAAGETIEVHDIEDQDGDPIGKINRESINQGEMLMLKNNPGHFANIIKDYYDGETADVWFQFCALGEIMYG